MSFETGFENNTFIPKYIKNLTLEEVTYINFNYSKRAQNKKYPKLIDYYTFLKNPVCVCTPPQEKKFSSQTNSTNYSNNMRIAQNLNHSLGGTIQFGNNNGNSIALNYLGRAEGMSRGGGIPPKNKF
jgi:hypothetical protein